MQFYIGYSKFVKDVIYSAGQELEGEGRDRDTLDFPGQQLALLQEVVASGNDFGLRRVHLPLI